MPRSTCTGVPNVTVLAASCMAAAPLHVWSQPAALQATAQLHVVRDSHSATSRELEEAQAQVRSLKAAVAELSEQVDGAREAHALALQEFDVRLAPGPSHGIQAADRRILIGASSFGGSSLLKPRNATFSQQDLRFSQCVLHNVLITPTGQLLCMVWQQFHDARTNLRGSRAAPQLMPLESLSRAHQRYPLGSKLQLPGDWRKLRERFVELSRN